MSSMDPLSLPPVLGLGGSNTWLFAWVLKDLISGPRAGGQAGTFSTEPALILFILDIHSLGFINNELGTKPTPVPLEKVFAKLMTKIH